MSKAGKAVFFILSIIAVILALKLVGNVKKSQKEIENLTVSLENVKADLSKVQEEKAALVEELDKEKALKAEIQRKWSQRVNEILEKLQEEKEKKIAWKNKFEALEKMKSQVESQYKETQRTLLSLKEKLTAKPSPSAEKQVAEAPSKMFPDLSEQVKGRIVAVARSYLTLELNRQEVAGIKPSLSIYRGDKLVKELVTKGIRYMTITARVSSGKYLEGIGKNDQVILSSFPKVAKIFDSPDIKGQVLDVINPVFLNVDLGNDGLGGVEPILWVYRNGELIRKIRLRDLGSLTIVVETAEGSTVKGVRKKDIVRITP